MHTVLITVMWTCRNRLCFSDIISALSQTCKQKDSCDCETISVLAQKKSLLTKNLCHCEHAELDSLSVIPILCSQRKRLTNKKILRKMTTEAKKIHGQELPKKKTFKGTLTFVLMGKESCPGPTAMVGLKRVGVLVGPVFL